MYRSLNSFRARLIILFGGLALVVGLAVTLYIERAAAERITAARGEKLQGVARSIANTLSESLVERTRELDRFHRGRFPAKGGIPARRRGISAQSCGQPAVSVSPD